MVWSHLVLGIVIGLLGGHIVDLFDSPLQRICGETKRTNGRGKIHCDTEKTILFWNRTSYENNIHDKEEKKYDKIKDHKGQ